MKNPKELNAVAVEYGRTSTPSVIAKGEGETARAMVERAFDLDLPVIEDETLQRLLSEVEIGEEVPESLYRSVAVVLSWVFWLRGDRPS
ncbi:EscU/YscU/HrcU family type III secretion system export apparatus switch protein [Luminiphilus sp.]|jgi:flagellar biosynthesis protein|nr:EscU/YscU/HrcU family type III secretion system export apparatus switch protein [bacterium]MDB2434584.1 EscU/YscU/HrcU family type III secretion system export apparatus switch protein [Luminiphilus sp.]MDB2557784.1 EscU/YscU/HrcU family type III secretion system export apparatus switch protein [Luminiphilus sp.]